MIQTAHIYNQLRVNEMLPVLEMKELSPNR